MIDRLHGEVEGHELNHRAKSGHGGSDAKARETMFGNRRVDDAPIAELLKQAAADFIGALILGDFFAHQKYRRIAPHLLRHGVAQRVAHSDFFQRRSCRQVRISRL